MSININSSQIRIFSDFLRQSATITSFDYCGTPASNIFPPAHQPGVLDLFFFVIAQQFGFWIGDKEGYQMPMVASRQQKKLKGSDYVFRCATIAQEEQSNFFSPTNLANFNDWNDHYISDDSHNPLPQWEEHLAIIQAYSQYWKAQRLTLQNIVDTANATTTPIKTFLELAGKIPGYREDPLQKKLHLLAVILTERPEQFLKKADPEHLKPIIDYHLMRSALRTGLIHVTNPELQQKLVQRKWVSEGEELIIRQATYDAVVQLCERSGLSIAAIDYFFFSNRTRCPEMATPRCETCPVNQICEKKINLFQPVFRTTAY